MKQHFLGLITILVIVLLGGCATSNKNQIPTIKKAELPTYSDGTKIYIDYAGYEELERIIQERVDFLVKGESIKLKDCELVGSVFSREKTVSKKNTTSNYVYHLNGLNVDDAQGESHYLSCPIIDDRIYALPEIEKSFKILDKTSDSITIQASPPFSEANLMREGMLFMEAIQNTTGRLGIFYPYVMDEDKLNYTKGTVTLMYHFPRKAEVQKVFREEFEDDGFILVDSPNNADILLVAENIFTGKLRIIKGGNVRTPQKERVRIVEQGQLYTALSATNFGSTVARTHSFGGASTTVANASVGFGVAALLFGGESRRQSYMYYIEMLDKSSGKQYTFVSEGVTLNSVSRKISNKIDKSLF